jgi:trehalose/maltose hydrolase-like predicted phosphorylase
MLAGTQEPTSSDLCPTIGNGFIGATVCAPSAGANNKGGWFLSGVYSGACPAPVKGAGNKRTVLPTAVQLEPLLNGTFQGMALDLRNGSVYRRYSLPSCDVQISYLAHRDARHLFVAVLTASNFRASSSSCVIKPTVGSTTVAGGCTRVGSITVCNSTSNPETSRQAPTYVAICADAVPASIILSAKQPRRAFIAAFATNLESGVAAGQASDELAGERWRAAHAQPLTQLEMSHRSAWSELWRSDITLGGNLTRTVALRSSSYYILSSVRADWPFGSSPGGLPSTSYSGHVFWDESTWFFPPLTIQFPGIAESIGRYRIRMLPEARRLAATTGYVGARFPWQSAVTGAECSPRAHNDSLFWTREMHVTPDVVMAQRLLHRMQRNSSWLRHELWPLLYDACAFLASFVVVDHASGNYTLMQVLPTTEVGMVDHPAYSTAATALSLQFCVDSARTLGVQTPANWSTIASRPFLPLNHVAFAGGTVHQVYDPYNGGHLAQAGVALLQYPLQFPMDTALAKRDLEYYGNKFDFGMMFFGQLTYAICDLRFGEREKADAVFELGFVHQVGHWNVWREHAPSGTRSPGSGAVNFLVRAC